MGSELVAALIGAGVMWLIHRGGERRESHRLAQQRRVEFIDEFSRVALNWYMDLQRVEWGEDHVADDRLRESFRNLHLSAVNSYLYLDHDLSLLCTKYVARAEEELSHVERYPRRDLSKIVLVMSEPTVVQYGPLLKRLSQAANPPAPRLREQLKRLSAEIADHFPGWIQATLTRSRSRRQ